MRMNPARISIPPGMTGRDGRSPSPADLPPGIIGQHFRREPHFSASGLAHGGNYRDKYQFGFESAIEHSSPDSLYDSASAGDEDEIFVMRLPLLRNTLSLRGFKETDKFIGST